MVYAIKKDLEDLIEFYKGMLIDRITAKNVAVEDLRDKFNNMPTHISIELLKALKEAEELI